MARSYDEGHVGAKFGGYTARSPLTLYLAASALLITLLIAGLALPMGVDWHQAFYPATRALWVGSSPYRATPEFNSPFWAVLPLGPAALLGEAGGRALLFLAGLIALCLVGKKAGGSPVAVGLFLISPPALAILLWSQLEWIVVLALVLPVGLGLPAALVKPQTGIGWFLWRMGELARRREWKPVVPLAVLALLHLAFFGLTTFRAARLIDSPINISPWPYGLPVGAVLLALAFRRHDARWAFAAGPFLTPYVLLHSLIVLLIPLLAHPRALAVAVILGWCALLIPALI